LARIEFGKALDAHVGLRADGDRKICERHRTQHKCVGFPSPFHVCLFGKNGAEGE
jgi:hypothetical protein